jgi:hypothetical protein
MQTVNNLALAIISKKQDQFTMNAASALNMKPAEFNKGLDPSFINPKLMEVKNRFIKNEITTEEFLKQSADIYGEHVASHMNEYNRAVTILANMSVDKMTGWYIFRSVTNIIRIVGVLSCAFLYLYLYHLISRRGSKAR